MVAAVSARLIAELGKNALMLAIAWSKLVLIFAQARNAAWLGIATAAPARALSSALITNVWSKSVSVRQIVRVKFAAMMVAAAAAASAALARNAMLMANAWLLLPVVKNPVSIMARLICLIEFILAVMMVAVHLMAVMPILLRPARTITKIPITQLWALWVMPGNVIPCLAAVPAI